MLNKLLERINPHLSLILLSLLVLRSSFLLISDLGLVGDESYYWDWSRHPDWCYFSKPPMVAWLIGLSTGLLGDSSAALRLPAVLLSTLFLWFYYATARACYGPRAAALALLLVLATPNQVLANLIMTIDPPLDCFWMMTLYYLQQALFTPRPRAWLWAGCAAALALLSKQLAIALPLLTLVFIVLSPPHRQILKREFWLFLAPILLAALPILLWNRQHDWVMFGHTQSHFMVPVSSQPGFTLKYLLELLAFQLLLISPIIFFLTAQLSLEKTRRFFKIPAQEQFLVLMGPVLLLGVFLLSLLQKTQGNWPMPFYFSALILLSGTWMQGRWKNWINYGLVLGLFLVGITYLLPAVLRVAHLQNTALDPIKRFRYWQQLAEHVQTQRTIALPDLENSFVLTLGHRNMTSELAFYLPDHPAVFRYQADGKISSQYEIWPGPQKFQHGNAFIVSDTENIPVAIHAAFQNIRKVGTAPNPKPANPPFYLYVGENLQQWPSVTQALEFQEAP